MTIDTQALAAAFNELAHAAQKIATAYRIEVEAIMETFAANVATEATAAPARRRESKPSPMPSADEPPGGDKMRRAILIALAQFGRPMTLAQIGLYSGKAHKARDDGCANPVRAHLMRLRGREETGNDT